MQLFLAWFYTDLFEFCRCNLGSNSRRVSISPFYLSLFFSFGGGVDLRGLRVKMDDIFLVLRWG